MDGGGGGWFNVTPEGRAKIIKQRTRVWLTNSVLKNNLNISWHYIPVGVMGRVHPWVSWTRSTLAGLWRCPGTSLCYQNTSKVLSNNKEQGTLSSAQSSTVWADNSIIPLFSFMSYASNSWVPNYPMGIPEFNALCWFTDRYCEWTLVMFTTSLSSLCRNNKDWIVSI